MPRGNDPDAAREFAERNPDLTTNAAELVRYQALAQSPELKAASRKPIDEEATADLDLSALSKKVDGEVVSAVVRGGVTVCVVSKDGVSSKVALDEDGEPAPAPELEPEPDKATKPKPARREKSAE